MPDSLAKLVAMAGRVQELYPTGQDVTVWLTVEEVEAFNAWREWFLAQRVDYVEVEIETDESKRRMDDLRRKLRENPGW